MTKDNRIALVTGAAGGIGRAIAARLCADGFHVVMTDLSAPALEAAAETISGSVETHAADLCDDAAREALVARAGEVFTLVNSAGIFSTAAFEELRADDFRKMSEVNTVATFDLCRLAAPAMRKAGGGRIVNIASRSFLGGEKIAHYAASKGAVVTLTRCLALELAGDGILVNAVAPGVIETELLRGWSAEERAQLATLQPLGRTGRPEDVATVVSMLSSPQTDYITGQTIIVDGGRSLGQ